MNAELKTYDRDKKTPFNGWNRINTVEQEFTDGAELKRNGKKVTLQEYMNEANQDLDIYQVYDAYRGDMKLTEAKLNTLTRTVSDELSGIKDLTDALEVMKTAEKAWRGLPTEIKKEFGNSVQNFQKNGLSWANQKIAAYEAEQARIKLEAEKAVELPVIKGETVNG